MDKFFFTSVGILMHNCNDRPFLSGYNPTCSYYWDLIDSMIVNSLDVYISTNFGNNPDIISSNPTISSSINESTFGLCGSSR